MSLSWWEGNINLFDWMLVSIVLGVGGMPEGHQQTGLRKHQLKIVSPSSSAFLHHYFLFALRPLHTHTFHSFIHSVLIQFLPCSEDALTNNPGARLKGLTFTRWAAERDFPEGGVTWWLSW